MLCGVLTRAVEQSVGIERRGVRTLEVGERLEANAVLVAVRLGGDELVGLVDGFVRGFDGEDEVVLVAGRSVESKEVLQGGEAFFDLDSPSEFLHELADDGRRRFAEVDAAAGRSVARLVCGVVAQFEDEQVVVATDDSERDRPDVAPRFLPREAGGRLDVPWPVGG